MSAKYSVIIVFLGFIVHDHDAAVSWAPADEKASAGDESFSLFAQAEGFRSKNSLQRQR